MKLTKSPCRQLILYLSLALIIKITLLPSIRVNEIQSELELFLNQGDVKIYIYEIPELNRYQLTLKNSQFATENMVHNMLLSSSVRVHNPAMADYFYVPIYPMGVVYKYKREEEAQRARLYDSIKNFIPSSLAFTACEDKRYEEKWCRRMKYQAGVLNYAVSRLKYWNDSGSRHIFLFPGGDQQNMFRNWQEVIGQSTHLLVEGHYGDYFASAEDKNIQRKRKSLDIVIPGGGDYNTMQRHEEKGIRKVFLSYCGRASGSFERLQVQNFFDTLKKYRKNVFFQESCSTEQFLLNLRSSRFCLAPAGSTPWTARLYGAIAQLCVPVLLNVDIFVPPYQLTSEFNSLSVRLSLKNDLERLVMEIIETDYEEKYSNLVAHQGKFMVTHSPPELFRELRKSKGTRIQINEI